MHPYMLEKLAFAMTEQMDREARSAERAARGREASRLEVHRQAERERRRLLELPVATE